MLNNVGGPFSIISPPQAISSTPQPCLNRISYKIFFVDFPISLMLLSRRHHYLHRNLTSLLVNNVVKADNYWAVQQLLRNISLLQIRAVFAVSCRRQEA